MPGVDLESPWPVAYAEIKNRLIAAYAANRKLTSADFARACVSELLLVSEKIGTIGHEVSLAAGWDNRNGSGVSDWPYTLHYNSHEEWLKRLRRDVFASDPKIERDLYSLVTQVAGDGRNRDHDFDAFEAQVCRAMGLSYANGISLPDPKEPWKRRLKKLREFCNSAERQQEMQALWNGTRKYFRIVRMLQLVGLWTEWPRRNGTFVCSSDSVPRFSVPEGLRHFQHVFRITCANGQCCTFAMSNGEQDELIQFKSGLETLLTECTATAKAVAGVNLEARFDVFVRSRVVEGNHVDIASRYAARLGEAPSLSEPNLVLEMMQRELLALASASGSVRMLPIFALREVKMTREEAGRRGEPRTCLALHLTKPQSDALAHCEEPFRLEQLGSERTSTSVVAEAITGLHGVGDVKLAIGEVQRLVDAGARGMLQPHSRRFIDCVLMEFVNSLKALSLMHVPRDVSAVRFAALSATHLDFARWLRSEVWTRLKEWGNATGGQLAGTAQLPSALDTDWPDSLSVGAAVAHSGLVEIAWNWATDVQMMEQVSQYPPGLYAAELYPAQGFLYIPIVMEHPPEPIGLCGVDVSDFWGASRQMICSVVRRYVPALHGALVGSGVLQLQNDVAPMMEEHFKYARTGVVPERSAGGMVQAVNELTEEIKHLTHVGFDTHRHVQTYKKLAQELDRLLKSVATTRQREEASALATQNLAHNIGQRAIRMLAAKLRFLADRAQEAGQAAGWSGYPALIDLPALGQFLVYLMARMSYLPVLPLSPASSDKATLTTPLTFDDLRVALEYFLSQSFLLEGLLSRDMSAEELNAVRVRRLDISYEGTKVTLSRDGLDWKVDKDPAAVRPGVPSRGVFHYHYVFAVLENLIANIAKHAIKTATSEKATVEINVSKENGCARIEYTEQTGCDYEHVKDRCNERKKLPARNPEGEMDNKVPGYCGLRFCELLLKEFTSPYVGGGPYLHFDGTTRDSLKCWFKVPLQDEIVRS